ncbi:hypothetical protein ACBY01_14385 [Sphingomonas sp. ac-8]|uniref:hypothetical protein n=1 Tax=Sphingomonas sp. ac-8 TaxID=3242977 RepID=UPI003A8081A6
MQRFEALLSGASGALHDRVLMQAAGCLVAPTVGALVPGWLLALPRQRALNFRELQHQKFCQPEAVVTEVRDHLGLSADEVIWFEHGPRVDGTPVGCGLDYAHIHILIRPPFEFSAFANKATALSGLAWRPASAGSAYADIKAGSSYLIAGCGNEVILTQEVEVTGSQFLRRVVAALVGNSDSWNYREHEHPENVAATVALFASLEDAARREG